MKRKLKIIKSENREVHEKKVNEFLEQETIEVLDISHDTVANVYHNGYGITSDILYITYITYIENNEVLAKLEMQKRINMFVKGTPNGYEQIGVVH